MRAAVLFLISALPAVSAERRVIGLAQDGRTPIEVLVPDGYRGSGGLLLIGGMNGEDASSRAVREEFEQSNGTVLAVPVANPMKSALVFPPAGVPYRENTESHALWRWIAMHAPDRVRVVGADTAGLTLAILRDPVAGIRPGELERRRARTPRQIADELAKHYGHDFNQLTYLPGMALIGQMRLGNVAQVARLAEPYVDPARDTLARAGSLTLAGHLVFAELARRTGDARYTRLVRAVGDLGFTPSGEMKESMPFHQDMSDSYFMAGPITAMAGSLTGERKYFDMAARHFRFLDTLVLRPDGLFRHSPLTDAAWGRGNAFPALGLALALSEFPENHPDRAYVLESYRRLMTALARYQDPDGMWHQIVDQPGSYQEFSATAMIATAMLRGIRKGWIDAAAYQPRVDRAWLAIAARIGPEGQLVDVCESTNKQPTYEDYLRRAAIFGKDERGGGMALLFATEMAGLE
jgi:rhamnogalacturonyl hydrolase YesR